MNFKRIENPDVDQSSDLGGVNVRGNRIMEMDMDVASGKIKLVEDVYKRQYLCGQFTVYWIHCGSYPADYKRGEGEFL